MRITGGRRRDDSESSGSATQLPMNIPATPSSSPESETPMPLNCGYNCSRYVYNQPVTRQSYDMLTDEEREVIKEEYFRTYDLMTGLRTAASLGGTILLFSLFILYKMKCSQSSRRRRRKSQAQSSVVDTELLDKEWSSPISEIRGGNSTSGCTTGTQRDSHVVLAVNTGSPSVVNVTKCSAPVHGAIPQFRFNSEPPMTSAVEPSIDIHITQPTPNISPSGSVRRLSEHVVADVSDNRRTDAVLIPLLTIPKMRTKTTKKSVTSELGSSSSSSSTRSRSDSAGQCAGDSTSSNRLPVTFSVGGKRLRRHPLCVAAVDIKYIDCSDSDACSSEHLGDGQPTTPPATHSQPTKFDMPSVHQARPGLGRTVLKVPSSGDAQTDDVSETQC